MAAGNKSIIITYILWLFGGFFGVHHFYLRRDKQAFLWWSTFGGYFGIGWLSDIVKIPRYVRECNNEPKYIEELIDRMKKNKKPPFSMNRFIGAISIGYFWATLLAMAIPEDEFGGIDWRFLHWTVPGVACLGVWVVGNMGHEKGSIWLALLASYISYPIASSYIYDDTYVITAVTLVGALVFDSFSKEWRRKPPVRRSLPRRIVTLGACAMIYFSIWAGYFYFNGKITDSDGVEVPVHEAIHHFFTSPWWTDLKRSLLDVWNYAQHHGWYEIWKQIIDLSDPTGEMNAYKVLGLNNHASQAEITTRWRQLSREWHPDKQKDPDLRQEAHEKFMEIQKSYEILSNSKSRRQRKNKKSNTD